MKKIKLIFLFILMTIVLSACNLRETSIDDRLKAPVNDTVPIEGRWTVTDYTPISESNIKEEKEYMGQPALFHRDALIFMNYYTVEPSFKMKKVDSVDYLLYKYKVNAKKLGIESENIEVFTVYNDNQLFMEVIKDSKDNVLLYIEDGFYKLENIEETVDKSEVYKYIDIEKEITKSEEEEEKAKVNSGILLGIKSSSFDEEEEVTNWDYSTLWINTEDKELQEVYKIEGLLLPRKNGFWEIDVNRKNKNGEISDTIEAKPKDYRENLENEDDEKSIGSDIAGISMNRNETLESKTRSFLRNILYVGNNYISTELIETEPGNKRTIKLQTLDNLKNEKSIGLDDLLDDGEEVFLEGAQSSVNLDESIELDEKNIGITRKNGYWMLNGRVNYKKNQEELYKDFIIKTVPPEEMVGHDNHFILWDEISRRIPNITDMYSSPNEDIILVRDNYQISIYKVEDGEIDYNSIGKINIDEGDSIVMSEWATGKYTEIWRNEVLKRDNEKIE